MWMQDDGCSVCVDSYMALNGPCFMVTWIVFLQKPPFGGGFNTKLGDHGTLNIHNR
jgi:hypothetical protein